MFVGGWVSGTRTHTLRYEHMYRWEMAPDRWPQPRTTTQARSQHKNKTKHSTKITQQHNTTTQHNNNRAGGAYTTSTGSSYSNISSSSSSIPSNAREEHTRPLYYMSSGHIQQMSLSSLRHSDCTPKTQSHSSSCKHVRARIRLEMRCNRRTSSLVNSRCYQRVLRGVMALMLSPTTLL